MAQIIAFSDTMDLAFDLRKTNKEIITMFVHEHKNTFFSPMISDVFCKISEQHEFWDALSDGKIDDSLKKVIPNYSKELNYYEIHAITKTLSKIIDAKSQYTRSHSTGLSIKLEKIAEFYKMDPIITLKLLISTDLHDLGKLAISNNLLDKPGKLSIEEYEEIKKHPKITRLCLQNIKGFEEITRWASNHHEKLDGSGYPEALKAEELDYNSRLITCLDIYQALREERPYRKSMDHQKAMEILEGMVDVGQLDKKIVDDINFVFMNSTN